MLIGEYEHTLDAKGRMIFPAKLREELGESFVLTRGLDGCLFVYSILEWKLLEEKVRSLPMYKTRDLQRFLFGRNGKPSVKTSRRIPLHRQWRSWASKAWPPTGRNRLV